MLIGVQLLVAGGCPEVLPVVGEVFFFLFAFGVGKGLTALFTKNYSLTNSSFSFLLDLTCPKSIISCNIFSALEGLV